MARGVVNVIAPLGPYPSLQPVALSLDFAFTALSGSSGSNGNQAAFGNYNRLMCAFFNSGGSGYTFTISSIAGANIFNRTGDITTYAIGIGLYSVIYVERNGWVQSDGNLYFEATNAAVKAAIFGIA